MKNNRTRRAEIFFLLANASIFVALLCIPRGLSGRIHPFSESTSKMIIFLLACGGVLVGITTLALLKGRWVIPTLCIAVSVLYLLQFFLPI